MKKLEIHLIELLKDYDIGQSQKPQITLGFGLFSGHYVAVKLEKGFRVGMGGGNFITIPFDLAMDHGPAKSMSLWMSDNTTERTYWTESGLILRGDSRDADIDKEVAKGLDEEYDSRKKAWEKMKKSK